MPFKSEKQRRYLWATKPEVAKAKKEVDEATGASSAGSYVGPLGYAKNEKNWRGAAKTQIANLELLKSGAIIPSPSSAQIIGLIYKSSFILNFSLP